MNLQKTQELVRALPVSALLTGIVVNRTAVAGSPVSTSGSRSSKSTISPRFGSKATCLRASCPRSGRVFLPQSRSRRIPDGCLKGEVQSVIPSLDPEKRTARLRVVLSGILKAC